MAVVPSRYAEILRGFSEPGAARPRALPGSPLVARALLRSQDTMLLHEIDAQSAAVLRRCLPGADVREADGLDALGAGAQGRAFVLLDPPYTQKQEWTDAARALEEISGTPAALWYMRPLYAVLALVAALMLWALVVDVRELRRSSLPSSPRSSTP